MTTQEQESYITYSQDEMEATELCIDIILLFDNYYLLRTGLLPQQVVYLFLGLFLFLKQKPYAEPQSGDGLDGEALICFYESCGFVQDGDCSELLTYTI